MNTKYGYSLDGEKVFNGWSREKVEAYIRKDPAYSLIWEEAK